MVHTRGRVHTLCQQHTTIQHLNKFSSLLVMMLAQTDICTELQSIFAGLSIPDGVVEYFV